MSRARALAAAILLVFYGAVGARQPAVRATVMLPVPADSVAAAAGLPDAHAPTLLLHLTRVLHEAPTGQDREADGRRHAVRQALWVKNDKPGEPLPLPLDPSIWRDTILQQRVDDKYLVSAILGDRRAALLYYGLSALDDETLAWLGPDRKALTHLRAHPGAFAAFGRSLRVRAGHVAVPGGKEAELLWRALVDERPEDATAFVRGLFRADGRLAFLYDTIAHLDGPHQRFALGLNIREEAARVDRFRELHQTFVSGANHWRVEDKPFARPPVDAAIMLGAVAVADDGRPIGPRSRKLWERVFSGDENLDVPFSEVAADDLPRDDTTAVDAAWLATRIGRVPYSLGRRRLDTFLFAQRVFHSAPPADAAAIASALRGMTAYPTLMLSLERSGVTAPAAYVTAARVAHAVNGIKAEPRRHTGALLFQGSLGILERATRSGGLPPPVATVVARSLASLTESVDDFPQQLSKWVTSDFIQAFPAGPVDGPAPLESGVLAAMAGVRRDGPPPPAFEWEGHRYRVDPAASELARMRQIRSRQRGPTLDDAVAAVRAASREDSQAAADADRGLGEVLASLLYAAHLGEPDGKAVTSGNVALRHDFGFVPPQGGVSSSTPWKLPMEDFASKGGWRIRGSLLGLEAALGRLSLRRVDPSAMPPGPRLGTNDLQTLMMMAALLNPFAMTDAVRDEIAASLARGRARASSLTADPEALDRAAQDAGLSEWRRQTLAWTAEHDRAHLLEQFAPVELFWLGAPRPSIVAALDAWGSASHPLSGCLCLEMPRPRAAEDSAGRPATGLLATRYADVSLRVADIMASLKVPAALAPGVVGFALQEVIDRAEPAFEGDPLAFGRAAARLTADEVSDYVAALTAGGPLVPAAAERSLESRERVAPQSPPQHRRTQGRR